MKNLVSYFIGFIGVLLAALCFIPAEALSLDSIGGATSVALIPVVDSRALYVNKLVAYFNEIVRPPSFLMSLFKDKIEMTREISIEVRRGTERIAVDVIRGTHGNYNKTSRSTMKTFLPPYYNEYFALNETDLYDQAIAVQTPQAMARLIRQNSEDAMRIKNKILRAYEKQCADVLLSGIITLVNGTNIDFKRKAGSMIDLMATNYWADSGVDAATALIAAGKFMRDTGKVTGGTFTLICGETAVVDLLNNEPVQKRADIRRYELDSLTAPMKNAEGGVYHGTISAGSYKFDIWSYTETYEDENGDPQNYVDPKKVIVVPPNPDFCMAYAAVPQLISNGRAPQRGKFLFQDYMDDRDGVHEGRIKSAGVAIPIAVDQIYTIQVVA